MIWILAGWGVAWIAVSMYFADLVSKRPKFLWE